MSTRFGNTKVIIHQRIKVISTTPKTIVVRLINDHVLPAERIGNWHRLLLDDVLAYREKRRKRQYDALAATEIDILIAMTIRR